MFLIFNFDGTGNEPEDGEQSINEQGIKEDDNISNVLKLHLLMGGNLLKSPAQYGQSTNPNIDHQFYYQGIGTYGTWWSKLLNTGVSPEKGDVATILNTALADFEAVYQPGAVVLVTGFSRGAALARRFVSILSSKSTKIERQTAPFIYLLAFDTVASIGLPNLSSSNRPDYDVVFEHGFTLSAYVKQAAHLLSLDDKRKAFQPTLMNHEPERIIELWFGGAHSDVGGGYYHDGLSDVALTFALNWLTYQTKHHQMPVIPITIPTQQQLNDACPDQLKGTIGIDDISRHPNPLGRNHQQKRGPLINWLTLDDRKCCVIADNQLATLIQPLIHHSVATRIHKNSNYKPKSLMNLAHKVWYDFHEQVPALGLQSHIQFIRQHWKTLKPSETLNVNVYANEPHNFTGLLLEKGQRYEINVSNKQTWQDGNITCGADGWNRDNVYLGLTELPIKLLESKRRVPEAPWFCLCASSNHQDDDATAIGTSGIFKAEKAGELILFANDLPSTYGNNIGSMSVTIRIKT